MEHTLESLCLLALPVEVYTDSHILDGERGIMMVGYEAQFLITVAIPQDTTLREGHLLDSLDRGTLGCIRLI